MLKTAHALIALGLLGAAVAQQAVTNPLKITSSTLLVKEVLQDGKTVEKFTDASNTGVLPGDLLQLNQKVQNVTAKALNGLNLNMKIPGPTLFQTSQCNSADVKTLYSIDGKTFGAAPLKKTVTVTENGKSVQKEVEVKPSEYTNVRWVIPTLSGNQTLECFIRVKVK